jgi:hypothetical protein
MSHITTEQIFSQLFAIAQTVKGTDWAGDSIPLQYWSRNWVSAAETPDGTMPALYQLDPMPERDIRIELGLSRRVLHAQIDIRMQRQQSGEYPDVIDTVSNTGPFSTILNAWIDNLYALFSSVDGGNPTLVTPSFPNGVVIDCYPISCKVDFGNDSSRVAIIYTIFELIAGF